MEEQKEQEQLVSLKLSKSELVLMINALTESKNYEAFIRASAGKAEHELKEGLLGALKPLLEKEN